MDTTTKAAAANEGQPLQMFLIVVPVFAAVSLPAGIGAGVALLVLMVKRRKVSTVEALRLAVVLGVVIGVVHGAGLIFRDWDAFKAGLRAGLSLS